jgi:hypothetical protein
MAFKGWSRGDHLGASTYGNRLSMTTLRGARDGVVESGEELLCGEMPRVGRQWLPHKACEVCGHRLLAL